MKEQIIKIIENSSPELAAEEILDLFSVSNCECKNLPEGEIAISSKALTNPNWKA